MNNFFKGNIFYADLGEGIGSEQGGIRPVVIIQNNVGNKFSSTVLIAPITSKVEFKKNVPTHVPLKVAGKIKNDSIILMEQIRVLDKQRLKSFIGKIDKRYMWEINRALIVTFGIHRNQISSLSSV